MNEATVKEGTKLSPIWIIPVVAALLGVWMVVHAQVTRGPLVAITFATAEGLEAGKTKVKLRAVELGLVEAIDLNARRDGVTVHARIDPESADLLHEDTQFWVVRPRLGPSGISGLGTILSGAFIELSPGVGAPGAREFRGLDDVPVTPATAPGLHLTLVGPEPATLHAGNPVLYRGYTVGRVESAELDTITGEGRYGIFVRAPYHDLVTTNSRFWNASGVSLEMSADGFAMNTHSMEAMLVGGVSFDLPEDSQPGGVVAPNTEFTLFSTQKSINVHPFTSHQDYVLLFDTSVRGLVQGAPVQYRGIQVGTVRGISFDYVSDATALGANGHIRVPVLIRLDPARVNLPDDDRGREEFARIMETGVKSGLRATLKSGNLLTGRLFVGLDFYDKPEPATIEFRDGHMVFPTVSSGLEQFEQKLTALLDKLQQLPIAPTLESARGALDEISRTAEAGGHALNDLDAILSNTTTRELPTDLSQTLIALEHTLQGYSPGSTLYDDLHRVLTDLGASLAAMERLTNTLNAKPNALIMSSPRRPDPQPGATLP